MKSHLRFNITSLFILVLAACASSPLAAAGPPDTEAEKLITLGEQALKLAQAQQGTDLRQVDTDLVSTTFRFVDHALTKEIMVVIPEAEAPVEKWSITTNAVSPLLSYAQPAINLQNLKHGPSKIAQAITGNWPGCEVRDIMLYLEKDKLTWTAFCNTPQGVVTGSMDDETAVFQASTAPPASLPSIATPVP